MQTPRLLVLLAALAACGSVACGTEAAPQAASPDEIEQGLDELLPEGRLVQHEVVEHDVDGAGNRADPSREDRATRAERRQRKARARVAETEVNVAESMLPDGCGDDGEECLPPDAWVDKL